MLKIRILLFTVSLLVIWLLFILPKHVVSNEDQGAPADSASQVAHTEPPQELRSAIASLREAWETSAEKEKSAIFADSLADRYKEAGRFDSAAWFAAEAASFFDT